MFRAARFNTIRRTLHTRTGPSSRSLQANRLAFVGAASAVALTYFAWRTSSPSKQLALDTNKKVRKYNYRRCPLIRHPNGLCAIAKRSKDVEDADYVTHLDPAPVLGPEPIQEQAESSTTSTTQEGDEPEGQSNEPQPGAAAYNPETGEINWDCPCLGGMAHGPCGMQFREAFSCFVFSEQEPKGIDCVEKFKAMQDCFREHPEIYAEGTTMTRVENQGMVLTVSVELDDDDDPDGMAEPPEVPVSTTEDSPLDTPQESTPTKLHAEHSA